MARKLDRSRELQKRAEAVIPGGVNSPVRAFGSVGGEPPFLVRGEGSRVYDADGNELHRLRRLLGTADPRPRRSAGHRSRHRRRPQRHQLRRIHSRRGRPRRSRHRRLSLHGEGSLRQLRNRSDDVAPSAWPARFTERKFIIKFEGCYHGHGDALLVKAGSGVATLGIPGSAGVPDDFVQLTLALPYNDLDALEEAFALHRQDRLRHRRTRRRQHGLRPAESGLPAIPPRDHHSAKARYSSSTKS